MKFTLRAVSLAVLAALGPAAHAACPADGATPFTASPVDPVNGFPTYVQDSNGLALELCLTGDGAGICFYDPPIPGNTFSELVGFGPEAFWWLAEATVVTSEVDLLVVMAAEAAWNAEVPAPGEQFPFTRLRLRMDTPEAGIYTITHPYGTSSHTLEAGRRVLNDTIDVPFLPNALNQGRVGPWLRSVGAPFGPDGGPAGAGAGPRFIGNGTPLPATGSPCGNNFVRVTATTNAGEPIVLDPDNVDGDGNDLTASSALFTIHGQIYPIPVATPFSEEAATYSRDATGTGHISVFVTAPVDATITADLLGVVVPAATDGQGRFFASAPLTAAPPTTVAVTGESPVTDPTPLDLPVTDVVSITRAEATCSGPVDARTCILAVDAVSSDAVAPPALDVTGFGNMAGGTLTTPALVVVPATVTVTSAAGGSDTESVRIINQ